MLNVRWKKTYLIMLSLFVALFIPLSSLPAFAQEGNAANSLLAETDTTPPTISNVSPANGQTITENTTLLSASMGDAGSGLNLGSIVFKLDGQPLDDQIINYMHGLAFTYSPVLPNGAHTFEIIVADQAGNVAQHSSVFYVQQSVWPAGSALLIEANGMHSITLAWTAAEESMGYRIYWGNSLIAEVGAAVLSYEVTELQSSSYYDFRVEAVLEGGGWTSDGPYVMAETLPLPHFPPTVWAVSPETGTRVDTANPVITAKIRAAGHGLQASSILLKVDNQVVPSSYDAATMTLTAAASGLADGYHSLLIRAADDQGIYEDYRGTFEVQAPPPNPLLERLQQLHAALAAGAPADMQAVRNLRAELAGLHAQADQRLIHPLWSKISAKLPAETDKAALKSSLLQLIKAFGAVRYDSLAADLDAIRTNEDFRAALGTIAAAGGQPDLALEDVAVFLIGDGDNRKGLEGTIIDLLAQQSKRELVQLLLNKQKQATLLRKALNKLLQDSEAYKLSSVFNELNVTSNDILATANNFRQRLQHDEPALRALTKAYVRLITSENTN
jgi:hypothetical protein